MVRPLQTIARKPSDCSDVEIADFMALVLAGGEVAANGLEGRIRSAASLVFLNVGGCLCGVAALKHPEPSYRKKVSDKSGIALSESAFPYEFGYAFILPSTRGRGLSYDLVDAAITSAGGQGVFATSRVDNLPMHKALQRDRFLPVGRDWESDMRDHRLRLFVRHRSCITKLVYELACLLSVRN